MTIAVVFPGQGSQLPGAGQPWRHEDAWSLVEEAEQMSDAPLAHLLLEASAAELGDTRASQLSVLAASLVAWRALEPVLETAPVGVAGHSLGQITALIAAGALDLGDGLALATARAEACADAQASTPGGMVALMGVDEATAADACARAPGAAWVANVNGAGQVVIGGEAEVLDATAELALELGARRARRLPVDGAFHTPLMQPASQQLSRTLEEITFTSPRMPVVTNHDARAVHDAHGWPERLSKHLVEPVRWAEVVSTLLDLGADTIIEVGPGSTLTGLVRRIAPSVQVRNVSLPEHLPAAVAR